MEFAIAERVSHNNKSNRKADDPQRRSTRTRTTTRTCILPAKKVELQKVAAEQNGTCKVWVTCRILSTERSSKRMSNVRAIGSEGLSRRRA
ncbi:uncharacterized protein Dsimw501_GD28106 [Drosophila simulans]|uniref:Uncharacterized protein n=1 Tax=Drosophila simulans TaxID=7240 RepID=A0A0J9R296_DROSI|nr:uncharacterized protein Dsimw501_GD28106 [Drosophila simulans]